MSELSLRNHTLLASPQGFLHFFVPSICIFAKASKLQRRPGGLGGGGFGLLLLLVVPLAFTLRGVENPSNTSGSKPQTP